MSSFGDQIEAARGTNIAVQSIEAMARSQVTEAFVGWAHGEYTDVSIRWRLESIIRNAYRSAAAIGIAHVGVQAGLPRWKPRWLPKGALRSHYLDGLVADVQRNLRDYKASPQTEVDLTRAISRISHSAGVAASRGQTDALRRSAKELATHHGFLLRKVWVANFADHTPCELCAALHGTEVDLEDEFPTDARLKVYGDLTGPPRHPHCSCFLVILVVGLENYQEEGSDSALATHGLAPESMTTEDVKNLPPRFFGKILAWLRKFISTLRSEQ